MAICLAWRGAGRPFPALLVWPVCAGLDLSVADSWTVAPHWFRFFLL